jgi:PAS domain-containing protein
MAKRRPLEAELQATLNVIPAYTWYALPSGALTFVNERTADYLGIPKEHPLRLGIDVGAEWDSHIPLLHPDDQEETRRVWSTCVFARAVPVRSVFEFELYCIGSGLISTLKNANVRKRSCGGVKRIYLKRRD